MSVALDVGTSLMNHDGFGRHSMNFLLLMVVGGESKESFQYTVRMNAV